MRNALLSNLIFVLALVAIPASRSSAETDKLNIVFIMADDLGPGWVDYECDAPQTLRENLTLKLSTRATTSLSK